MVGAEMLRVLEQRMFPVRELVPIASARSAGKTITFRGAEHTVVEIAPEVFEGVDLALFSAGGGTSREWSPVAASKGALVVDNAPIGFRTQRTRIPRGSPRILRRIARCRQGGEFVGVIQ